MKRQSVYRSAEGEALIKAAYEEALGTWPQGFERIEFQTRLGKTFVMAAGETSKPPLVLLHGTLSNSAMWTGEIARFARERRVYAIDIPGEPGYSEPYRASWRDDSYAAWLAESLDTLGLKKPALVGLSLGGKIALSLTVTRPGRASALGLLCPSGIGPARGDFLLKALISSFRGERGKLELNASLYGKTEPPPNALRYGSFVSDNSRPSFEPIPLFTDAELAGLALPILLIVGGLDPLLDSRKSADRLARLQPGAKIRFLPEAGHALLGFGEELLDFFRKEGA